MTYCDLVNDVPSYVLMSMIELHACPDVFLRQGDLTPYIKLNSKLKIHSHVLPLSFRSDHYFSDL